MSFQFDFTVIYVFCDTKLRSFKPTEKPFKFTQRD